MVTMNIKDPQVNNLARELAVIKGSTATGAIREALEHELSREKERLRPNWDGLSQLQKQVADTSHLWLTDDEVYDENGMPQ